MRCPKCDYERQLLDDDFVPEGECPRCGIVYSNYLQATFDKTVSPSSTGDIGDLSHRNEGKAGRAVTVIAFGVVLCCLAYYLSPLFMRTWDGLHWEARFKEASALYDQELYHEAVVPASRALAGAESRFGPDSVQLAGLLDLLGKIHGEIGNDQLAVEYLERLRSLQEQTLGESHQDTRDTMTTLISMYYKLGMSDKAKPLMSKLVLLHEKEAQAQVLSPDVFSYTATTPPREAEGPVGKANSPGKNGSTQTTVGASNSPKEKDAASLSRSHQVELYIVSWCPYCRRAVNFFQSSGIPFTAYDIEKDRDAAVRKNKLDSGRGVPFAVIDGKKIHGYSEEAYRRALDHK